MHGLKWRLRVDASVAWFIKYPTWCRRALRVHASVVGHARSRLGLRVYARVANKGCVFTPVWQAPSTVRGWFRDSGKPAKSLQSVVALSRTRSARGCVFTPVWCGTVARGPDGGCVFTPVPRDWEEAPSMACWGRPALATRGGWVFTPLPTGTRSSPSTSSSADRLVQRRRHGAGRRCWPAGAAMRSPGLHYFDSVRANGG